MSDLQYSDVFFSVVWPRDIKVAQAAMSNLSMLLPEVFAPHKAEMIRLVTIRHNLFMEHNIVMYNRFKASTGSQWWRNDGGDIADVILDLALSYGAGVARVELLDYAYKANMEYIDAIKALPHNTHPESAPSRPSNMDVSWSITSKWSKHKDPESSEGKELKRYAEIAFNCLTDKTHKGMVQIVKYPYTVGERIPDPDGLLDRYKPPIPVILETNHG